MARSCPRVLQEGAADGLCAAPRERLEQGESPPQSNSSWFAALDKGQAASVIESEAALGLQCITGSLLWVQESPSLPSPGTRTDQWQEERFSRHPVAPSMGSEQRKAEQTLGRDPRNQEGDCLCSLEVL